RLKEGNTVQFKFQIDDDFTLFITKDWQAEKVEGRRKLLPVLVEFYGVPKAADIEAVEIKKESPVLAGSFQAATAVFRNNGPREEIFTAEYYAGGKKAGSEKLQIKPGETKERKFNWQAADTAGSCRLRIHAVPVEGEQNIENNTKETNVLVQTPNYAQPDCRFSEKLSAFW
ncbi:MAG: hypothetical protein NUV48_15550, partial [Peptococcaceae bacterium]|nr:hypothetical protein [Peptococcaceae bacterium]